MSEPSDSLGGIASRRRAYEREMAAPKRPSKFWSDCALWHEAETLDVLEAAAHLRAAVRADYGGDYERWSSLVCSAAMHVAAELDALEGEREPLDGDA